MKPRRTFCFPIFVIVAAVAFTSCSTTTPTTTTPAPTITSIDSAISGSGAIGSQFTVAGTGFQTITTATTGYTVDFRDVATSNIIATAPVDFSVSGNWTDNLIKATVPGGLTLGTTYKFTVTTPIGTSPGLNFLIVSSVSFSPSTSLWSQTLSLPSPRQGIATIAAPMGANTFLFAIGGNTGTPGAADASKMNISSVYQAMLNGTDGSVQNASWTTASPLPVNRGFAAAVYASQYNSLAGGSTIYVLGGLDETGTATNTVILASITANGSIPSAGATGTWSATTALPQPLYGEAAAILHGRIYVAGGNDSSGNPVDKVYTALINGDGTLGTWAELTSLPTPLAYHQLVALGNYLYVLGGEGAATDPVANTLGASVQDTVYSNYLIASDGTLSNAWTANPNPLTTAREKFSAVGAVGFILISGGLYNGTHGSSEQSYASVNTDGSLSAFTVLAGTHTIRNTSGYNFFNHGCAFAPDASGVIHVYILGGGDVDTGALHSEVWFQH